MEHINPDIIRRSLKRLRFLGSTRKTMADLPDLPRNVAGYQLFEVQRGRTPEDFKPMAAVGAGVYELRVHSQQEHRVFYVAKFPEAVYVLHVFEKRTRKTDDHDIRIGQRRYAEMQQLRLDEGRT